MFDKLIIFMIRNYSAKPFYIAFIWSIVSALLIFFYPEKLQNELMVYGAGLVTVSFLINVLVSTVFWGIIVWIVLVCYRNFKR